MVSSADFLEVVRLDPGVPGDSREVSDRLSATDEPAIAEPSPALALRPVQSVSANLHASRLAAYPPSAARDAEKPRSAGPEEGHLPSSVIEPVLRKGTDRVVPAARTRTEPVAR